jgi:50S ribosomal subunit-associated GTPase HflX
MEADILEDLRAELARLEAREARLSAQRRHLHNQIDYGYATDSTKAREREVSDERQELHRRIDELRELLRARESVQEPQRHAS